MYHRCRVRFRPPQRIRCCSTPDSLGFPETRRLVTTYIGASLEDCVAEFPDPQHPEIVFPQRKQVWGDNCVLEHLCKRHAAPGRIVSTEHRLQHPADELDAKLSSLDNFIFVGIHKGDYLWCWRSNSVPKKLAVCFRNSLARFNSEFSCSSV
jgi:hypothetical protein